MKKKIYIVIILLTIFAAIFSLWWNQGVKPVNISDLNPVKFTVKRGESVKNIADKLQKSGLIRSPLIFFLYTRFGSLADKIQAGEFRLTPSMDMYTVANNLTHGTNDIWITIPEGLRSEEIALKLTKELSIPESEFLKHAKEGYLFPDTYLFPQDASPTAIVNVFLNNFDKKIPQEFKTKSKKEKNLGFEDVLIIASLIEREAKFDQDRPIVASVILNRLKIGMKLDIDATVQYALGYQAKEKTWWKKELTIDDLAIDSPFNTYANAGLPPKPIANPGLAAIKAVIEAPETDYFYYVSDKTGKIHPAKDLEEHESNISKYLNK